MHDQEVDFATCAKLVNLLYVTDPDTLGTLPFKTLRSRFNVADTIEKYLRRFIFIKLGELAIHQVIVPVFYID